MSQSAFRDSYISNSTHTTDTSSSSTRPFVRKNTNTATMSELDAGKAPVNGTGSTTPKRNIDEPLVKIQPPRREDLQPSYARAIKPDEAQTDDHGWYGAMVNSLGACIGTLGAIPCCVVCPVRRFYSATDL